MNPKKTKLFFSVLFAGLFIRAEAVVSGKRPSFKKQKIEIFSGAEKKSIKKATLNVEIADSGEKWEFGLMFKKNLADNEGMLFVFPEEQIRQFWMKNTFVDLDIGYFDAKKTLISIAAMKAVNSEMEANLPIYPSKGPAQYALEVPKGWFKKHKVEVDDKLVLP